LFSKVAQYYYFIIIVGAAPPPLGMTVSPLCKILGNSSGASPPCKRGAPIKVAAGTILVAYHRHQPNLLYEK